MSSYFSENSMMISCITSTFMFSTGWDSCTDHRAKKFFVFQCAKRVQRGQRSEKIGPPNLLLMLPATTADSAAAAANILRGVQIFGKENLQTYQAQVVHRYLLFDLENKLIILYYQTIWLVFLSSKGYSTYVFKILYPLPLVPHIMYITYTYYSQILMGVEPHCKLLQLQNGLDNGIFFRAKMEYLEALILLSCLKNIQCSLQFLVARSKNKIG